MNSSIGGITLTGMDIVHITGKGTVNKTQFCC